MRCASPRRRFPAKQSVSKPAELHVKVLNEQNRTVPNVAVTVDSFSYVEKYPELAADKRPIWVVEEGPGTPARAPVQSQAVSPAGGGQTAYINTWALGPLKANQSETFTLEGRAREVRRAHRAPDRVGRAGGQRQSDARPVAAPSHGPSPRRSRRRRPRATSTRPRARSSPGAFSASSVDADRAGAARLARCRSERASSFARR